MTSFGLAIIGAKSVIAPTPKKISGGTIEQLHALVGVVEQAARLGEVGSRHVGDDAGEADADQQQRLVALDDRQIDHGAADGDHHQVAPPEMGEAGLIRQRAEKRKELFNQRTPLQARNDVGDQWWPSRNASSSTLPSRLSSGNSASTTPIPEIITIDMKKSMKLSMNAP